MRGETEMVAYALEVDPRLLPWIPELLSDFDELGSDAALIVSVLRDLALPAPASVVDLGCGKGAVAVAIAKTLGHRVEGIDLFEPFIESCLERAAAAGVSGLCSFRHADILKLAGRGQPADAVVYAALGDVLGTLDETIGVVRRFVGPHGYILIHDGYIKDGGAADFPGYQYATSRDESLRQLQSHGDLLVREVIPPEEHAEAYGQELARIRRRAEELAERHPELKAELLGYVEHQRQAYAYMATNIAPVVWVLQRAV